MRYMEMHAKRVMLDGRPVRYCETGAGKPLLLLHAFPLSADMWEPQLEVPPAGWRLVAPDLRGFRGPNDPDGGAPVETGVTMEHYARDVLGLLDFLEVDRAVIAGLSMGGYVAFALLRLAAHRVGGLVLADTRAQADTDEGRQGRREMQALVAAEGAAAVARRMLPALLGEQTHADRPDVVSRVRALIEANHPAAIAAALGALMTRPDSTALLTAIRCPTLVIVGAEDTLTPPALSAELQKGIEGSRLVIIPSAGHLSNLEQPEDFNAALARFLAERC